MMHEDLEAIRASFARIMKTFPSSSYYGPAAAQLLLSVGSLVAYIDELHGIVHDLRQEPGYALGRQDILREVLDVLGKVPVRWNADYTAAVADPQSLAIVLDLIECLGPVAPHLAPDDLRRENEALRAVLTAVVDAEREPMMLERLHRLEAAIVAARRLLGDV